MTQNENRRDQYSENPTEGDGETERERDGDKTTFKEIVLRALYLLVRSVSFFFFFVSAG